MRVRRRSLARPCGRGAVRLVGAVTLLLVACGGGGRQGVAMDQFPSDIVFGVPTPTAVTQAQAPTPLTPDNALSLSLSEPSGPGLPAATSPPLLSEPPASDCPAAGLTSFPAAPAGTNVAQLPLPGAYRWKQAGAITVNGRSEGLSGFQVRLLRRVNQVSDQTNPQDGQPNLVFTFQTVEPFDATGNSIVLTWQVMTDAPSRTQGFPLSPLYPTPVPGSASVNDPEGGLVLKAIDYVDTHGNTVSGFAPFKPAVGVLYVPLPLQPGQQWTSTATDPTSQTQVQLSGTVGGGRERIDACGDVVDSWPVQATLTTTLATASGAQTQKQTDSFDFAPQLGGLVIAEAIGGDSAWGPISAAFSLGQLHPGPIPAGQQ